MHAVEEEAPGYIEGVRERAITEWQAASVEVGQTNTSKNGGSLDLTEEDIEIFLENDMAQKILLKRKYRFEKTVDKGFVLLVLRTEI